MVYADFTQIVYRSCRAKAQLIPLIDHSSKLAVDYAPVLFMIV